MLLPARTDVAIIGGGFAGCATAWALARRGVSAIVLEREDGLGRFASGRGAGLGRQLAEDDGTTVLTVRGAAMLRRELVAAWRPAGGVLSFDDPARAQAYLARAERHGVGVTALTRAQVVASWPALSGLEVVSGLAVATDGVIDVRRLLALYAAGLDVALGTGVDRVEPGGIGAQVTTTRGVIEARVVVDAAGPWAGASTGDPPLEAYKRHLFVLEAAARGDAPYLWHLGCEELYVRTDGDAMLTSACDAQRCELEDPVIDPIGEAGLRAVLARVAPVLATAPLRRQWACLRSFTPDRQMRLGRDPRRPWLVWAAALGGHGATASPAIGELVADAVLAAT